MSRPRTLVLFDVDGTLIDSQSHILGAMEFAFKARGLVVPPAAQVLRVGGEGGVGDGGEAEPPAPRERPLPRRRRRMLTATGRYLTRR